RIVREDDAVRREQLPWRELAGDPALARLTSPRPAPFDRPLLMGILNVTPDSFARDTRFPLWEDAVAHGLRLIEEGADIVDVGGLAHDTQAPAVAAGSGARVVLMHMRGEPATMNEAPAYVHAALEVYDELEERIRAAEAAGIARDRLIVDPGLCFAKHEPHNL